MLWAPAAVVKTLSLGEIRRDHCAALGYRAMALAKQIPDLATLLRVPVQPEDEDWVLEVLSAQLDQVEKLDKADAREIEPLPEFDPRWE